MNFMREAVNIAKQSGEDLPIGAVIVKNGKIISAFHNEKEAKKESSAHAEMLALQDAQRKLKTCILEDCEIYVTLEPCPMCAWAIIQAKIKKVYFGAYDTLYGAFGSVTDLRKLANSKTEVIGGLSEEECSTLIKEYFKKIR
ncbi:MAG: nucleoside deaminase [Candidatus Gastranaerophilales bacterium]|nr:nucleoside deaminase [Candidatus Gastranaerophilales bacterium]